MVYTKNGNLIIIALILFLSLSIHPAFGWITAANDRTDCYPLAVEFQNVHGGDLIFIQPLTTSGAFDLGRYNGHWMNKAWSKERGAYYYDVQDDEYFQSKEGIFQWYNRIEYHNIIIYNVNQEAVPFPLIR